MYIEEQSDSAMMTRALEKLWEAKNLIVCAPAQAATMRAVDDAYLD